MIIQIIKCNINIIDYLIHSLHLSSSIVPVKFVTRFSPGSNMALSFIVFIASFNLEEFLSPLSFTALTFLKREGQLFYTIFLDLGLSVSL